MSRSAFRLVPPAGAPVPARTVLPSILAGAGGAAGLVAEQLGVRQPFFVSSGRAALTLVLQAMREHSHRSEVIIPAYTCFSVASAVARAGLSIRLCDVAPGTLDLDRDALARLDLDRALCIVPSGLYGLPSDLVWLVSRAGSAGAFVVDDAAQCLGATLDGRQCGTFGDAGFFSLGRGKGITTMGGGILVTSREDLARSIQRQLATLRRPSLGEVGVAVGTSLLYSGLLRPSLYWLVDRLPFLELGASHFDPDFPMSRLSTYQEALVEQVLPLVDAYNKARRDNADHLRAGLEGVDGIELPRPVAGASPVYLRFPILTRGDAHRSLLRQRLRDAGISASTSYPTPIGDIPGIGRYLASGQMECPAASAIATRILTLPTHPWVTTQDIERMVAVVRNHS